MTTPIRVTILLENTSTVPELETAHGMAVWVEDGAHRILFDAGTGDVVARNADALGVDLGLVNSIVLSHGHYDHTTGLTSVFERADTPAIYMHPEVTRSRYGCLQTPPHKPIGMPDEVSEELFLRQKEIVLTTQPTQISPHVWATGPIPRLTEYEDTGGPFFVNAECTVPDLLRDDQALWLETADGIVVLLGCAHSGIINTLDYIADITGVSGFHAVLGGTHLLNATPELMEETLQALKKYISGTFAPCHCTGEAPLQTLKETFAQQFVTMGTGSRFEWSGADC